MELLWLEAFAKSWHDRVLQNRLPHAVLLLGPVGTGKRCAAAWMSRISLGIEPEPVLPEYPVEWPEHADLRRIAPAEDKDAIGIEQIRELVADLSLTSYSGKGKVAVIEPANRMTANAANSLLKTLEEPEGDALLVLIADRIGRLPATIFSRCQRIDFGSPATDSALGWLDQLRPGTAWVEALRVAGGAPLAAIAAHDSLDTGNGMARDLNQLGQGKGSAIEVAARWAKLDTGFVLDWLARQVQESIVALAAGRERAPGLAIDDFVLRRMDRPNLFCYLDIINRLRGQPGGSYNVQLTLEGLLIDWADGLAECGLRPPAEGMELMLAGRR
jgi:DNA polymerase-3 subunit delta'